MFVSCTSIKDTSNTKNQRKMCSVSTWGREQRARWYPTPKSIFWMMIWGIWIGRDVHDYTVLAKVWSCPALPSIASAPVSPVRRSLWQVGCSSGCCQGFILPSPPDRIPKEMFFVHGLNRQILTGMDLSVSSEHFFSYQDGYNSFRKTSRFISSHHVHLKTKSRGPGEMCQWLRATTTFPEDPS